MTDGPPERVIEAGRTERHYWRDLWNYRELFIFLAWRDILVRYKQTAIGVTWGLLRPVMTMVVFTIVFGRIAKLPSNGVPYPILVFSAMLPWQLFASAISEGSASLIDNANIISKVYFPRVIAPASAVTVCLVDFLISLILLGVLMLWYQFMPSARVLMLPGFLMLALLITVGLTLLLAALNVKYRDFRYVVPFLVQFGLFISPVGFSTTVVPEHWRWLYSLNPLVGVIEGFRWCLFPSYSIDLYTLLPGVLVSVVLLAWGFTYFRKTERFFADII